MAQVKGGAHDGVGGAADGEGHGRVCHCRAECRAQSGDRAARCLGEV